MIDTTSRIDSLLVPAAGHRRPERVERAATVREDRSAEARRQAFVASGETLSRAGFRPATEGLQPTGLDRRARQAVAAYTAFQHGEERAYVARLLGVDEYV